MSFGYRKIAKPAGVSVDVAHGRSSQVYSFIRYVYTADPTWLLGGAAMPYMGEIVEKVGQTTGWTRGDVTHTCVDETTSFGGNPVMGLLCQARADFYTESGDSGSPVFTFTYGQPSLLGMFHSTVPNSSGSQFGSHTYASFSTTANLQREYTITF